MEDDDIPTMKTEDLILLGARALVQVLDNMGSCELCEATGWPLPTCKRFIAIANEIAKRNI